MSDRKIEALLTLCGNGRGPIGRDRIAMLEGVAMHGSISQAARVLGFSYKAVWEGVNALNNLLPRPVVIAQSGGKKGGRANITEDGCRLIAAFRRLEEKLSRISQAIAEDGLDADVDMLFWSVAMKTSISNVFHCQVTDVRWAPYDIEVTLRLTAESSIVAVVSHESASKLRLVPGRMAMALIKSSFVILLRCDDAPRVSARNLIRGVVVERLRDDEGDCEIILDIGSGKSLNATITMAHTEEDSLSVGDEAYALFDACHVILVAD